MRLSEDIIRYMTVKQSGALPTPKANSKVANQSEKTKDKDEIKDKPSDKEELANAEAKASEKPTVDANETT